MLETTLEKIMDKDCDYADPACMLLSNLTRCVPPGCTSDGRQPYTAARRVA